MQGSVIRTAMAAAALGGLLAAAPAAQAHNIDVRKATAAVRAEAEALGEVDRVTCRRPVAGGRRSRHRAACVSWWVRLDADTSCTIFWEVRMARQPSRRMVRLVVDQTFEPWCT